MNRNTEQHFATIPEAEIGRSKFDRSKTMKTTFNTGDIIPIYVDTTIMPGDTVKMNMGSLIRMITPIAPTLDSLWMDTYFFFCPHRLVWTDFKKFMGENTNPWKQTSTVTVPKLNLHVNEAADTSHVVEVGSLINYMGIPLNLGTASNSGGGVSIAINHLPIRAYCKIWNDWFRDQNTEKELYYYEGSGVQNFNSRSYAEAQTDKYTQFVQKGAICAKANRIHDYFSSALPEPQKGPSTLVPLVGQGQIEVGQGGTGATSTWTDIPETGNKVFIDNTLNPPVWGSYDENGLQQKPMATGVSNNLVLDMEGAVGATVNAIRQAFAIQKFYERQARGGWACALASS